MGTGNKKKDKWKVDLKLTCEAYAMIRSVLVSVAVKLS